jgi:hypothetical protein
MPFYEKGDVRIRYEMVGSGFPLLVTPGGGLPRGPRPRGRRRGPQLGADVCDALPQGQDRSARCPRPGRDPRARRLLFSIVKSGTLRWDTAERSFSQS